MPEPTDDDKQVRGGGKRDPKKEFNARKPAPDVVGDFHANSDVDAHGQALHHTLGFGASQAAGGAHTHDVSSPDSVPLWSGVTLNDPATNASVAELSAAIAALNALIRQKATN